MTKKRYLTKVWKRHNKQIKKIYQSTGGVTIDGDPITFRQFKHRVLARAKAENITIRKAAVKERNTESFVSAGERSRFNLTSSIKEQFPEVYAEMKRINRGLRNEKGQFTSMYKNMKWSKEFNGYVLGDYVIDVSNSPKGVFLTPIDRLRK